MTRGGGAEGLLTNASVFPGKGRWGAVPLVRVRPSIIAASWRRPFPGWIDSAAAFASFAVGIGSGRMRVVLAQPIARLDLVPVDGPARAGGSPATAPSAARRRGRAGPRRLPRRAAASPAPGGREGWA